MYNFDRFLIAQESDYNTALAEVKAGKKQSHWMWYIFPQLKGLGSSDTAAHYAIDSLAEAEAYLQHPILGCRLIAICDELLKLSTNDANVVFGYPDELKLKSSLTLFEAAADQKTVFAQVLAKFFNEERDQLTLKLLDC
jgi:uncharacterized protein (DUF1810 family)